MYFRAPSRYYLHTWSPRVLRKVMQAAEANFHLSPWPVPPSPTAQASRRALRHRKAQCMEFDMFLPTSPGLQGLQGLGLLAFCVVVVILRLSTASFGLSGRFLVFCKQSNTTERPLNRVPSCIAAVSIHQPSIPEGPDTSFLRNYRASRPQLLWFLGSISLVMIMMYLDPLGMISLANQIQ